jgi:hypothetical protein
MESGAKKKKTSGNVRTLMFSGGEKTLITDSASPS